MQSALITGIAPVCYKAVVCRKTDRQMSRSPRRRCSFFKRTADDVQRRNIIEIPLPSAVWMVVINSPCDFLNARYVLQRVL